MKWLNVIIQGAIGEVFIYGEISDSKFWGDEVTPTDIKDELAKLKKANEINIYVNSPGGNVFAGVAIYNEIKRLNKPVTSYVDGIAASIASLIILAADRVVMPQNSMLMIHNVWTIAMGDAQAFRDLADRLDKITDSTILEAYQAKTGIDKAELKKMLDDETWLSAAEAVDLGFADEVQEDQKLAACLVGDSVKFKDTEIALDKFKAFPKDKFTEYKPEPKATSLKQRHEHNLFMLEAQI